MTLIQRCPRWLKIMALGPGIAAITVPGSAQAFGGLSGPESHLRAGRPAVFTTIDSERAAFLEKREQFLERGCRPPAGCPSSGSPATAPTIAPVTDGGAQIEAAGVDWSLVGVLSGAALVLLTVGIALFVRDRNRSRLA